MSAIAGFFRRCGLFRGFDDARLETLIRAAGEVSVAAGADILCEGDSGDAMFVVLAGAVQVYTRRPDGREVVLARLEAGDHFGEQALLPGGTGRRNASVRAAEPVRLASLPKAAFQAALSADDALRERLIKIGTEQVLTNLQHLSPLARGLGLDHVDALRRALPAGGVLFRQGDEADALYFVNSGRLSAWREEDGKTTQIGSMERPACVGELGLMRRERRSATVIAEEPTDLLAIPRAAFDEAYKESAIVQEHLATLQRAYELPQRGILTQHAGTFAGHECITTLYHLNDGGVIAAYRVVGQSLYAVERLGAPTAETLKWGTSGQSRELRIDTTGTIVGITAQGDWPDSHSFHLLVLDGGRISPAERDQFVQTGRFALAPLAVALDAVCHCLNVSGETLRTAISNGARTFTSLQKLTGCGTVCGGCVPVVAEMLGVDEWVLADVVAEYDEAAGIRSFELVPRQDSYPEAVPGQHIVVEGMVGGLRLRRPYTLSSAGRHNGRLRITVKREGNGAFSPWLFDGRPKGEPLRITRPRGEYVIDVSGQRPAICLVAGIGVTPAVAAARSATNGEASAALLIHYSGRTREQMACLPELEAAAQRKPVEMIVRETSRQGHVDAAAIGDLATRFPMADWYLCGPTNYLQQVEGLLKQANVSSDRVHVEAFTPVGSAPAATEKELAAIKQHMLVKPVPESASPLMKMFKKLGAALATFSMTRFADWRVGAIQLNPIRRLEEHLGRAARIDPAVPFEYMGIVSSLSFGVYKCQELAFTRNETAGAANRERARKARADGRPISGDTPDGDTYAYWLPVVPFPKFPKSCVVDTGWTKAGPGRVTAMYITRSRMACEHLLRTATYTDRGPLPYHFLQQAIGRTDIASCPGRKASGLFAGEFHDNATWTEDRALAVEMFSFGAVDKFTPAMSAAAGDVRKNIDQILAREPDIVIDLSVMLSKLAYTVIVKAIFGDVDLAEMHGLGRTLLGSIQKAFDYVYQFVMGRATVPRDYEEAILSSRLTVRKMIDLLRDLDRQGKLNEAQRTVPIIRLILDTAGDADGAHERLYSLVLTLIIAGHETTGHTMSWAIYEMARTRKLEEAVLAEIETFRSTHGSRPLTTADYDERPMSWALLAECLRRHPPLQTIPRTPLEDGVVPPDPETGIGGFRYPAGAMISFSVIGIHLDPRRWRDPCAFRPERWLENVHEGMSLVEKGRTVRATLREREQAFDWLSFSDGPGRCPGQHFNAHEFMLILDTLIPHYRFEIVRPEDEVRHNDMMVVGPEKGRMAVRIRPRKKTERNS